MSNEKPNAIVSNTIVAIEKKSWLRTERRASLLRVALVIAVHVALVAALLSWSWPPAPIEVSILSLEDLGGDTPVSQEMPAPERSTPEVEAADSTQGLLLTAVTPARELAQPQQIDIALSRAPPPVPEPQVAPEVPLEQLSEAQAQPAQTTDTAMAAPHASIVSTPTTPAPTQTTPAPTQTTPAPTPTKAAATPTVRPTPDLDASARPRSAAQLAAPIGGATATGASSSTDNKGLAGQASGSAQPGAGAEPALTAARFDADYLHNPAPAYPSQSRRLKEEGTVLLLVRVSAEGTPLSVEIRTSSGFERLDEAGVQAVRQWRFVPAKRGNESVAAAVLVPIQFKRQ